MSVMKDFKEFAMRGNVLDMAVGVVIGAAFGKIIASLVTDILMPPIGLLIGGVDFSNLFINLSGPLRQRLQRLRRRACLLSLTVFLSTPLSISSSRHGPYSG